MQNHNIIIKEHLYDSCNDVRFSNQWLLSASSDGVIEWFFTSRSFMMSFITSDYIDFQFMAIIMTLRCFCSLPHHYHPALSFHNTLPSHCNTDYNLENSCNTHPITYLPCQDMGWFLWFQSVTYRWLSARLQNPQCVSNGNTAVLHQAIDMFIAAMVYTVYFFI